MDEATIQLKYLAAKDLPGTIVYWFSFYSPYVNECARNAMGSLEKGQTRFDWAYVKEADVRGDGEDPRYPIFNFHDDNVIQHPEGSEMEEWVCYGCGRELAGHG